VAYSGEEVRLLAASLVGVVEVLRIVDGSDVVVQSVHPKKGSRVAGHVSVHVELVIRGQGSGYTESDGILKEGVRIGLRAFQNEFVDFEGSPLLAGFLSAR
jgi:hypothetical protein